MKISFHDKHVSTDMHVKQAGSQFNTKERIFLNMAQISLKNFRYVHECKTYPS